MIEGRDFSHHNRPKDYSLDGISFVAVRISYGGKADEMADEHLAKARAAGVPVLIGYHWISYSPHAPDPEEQAHLFVTRAAVLGGDLGLSSDVEPLDPKKPDPPARVRDYAVRFWRSARARAGRPVATYGGDYLGTLDLPGEMAVDPLWRSDWTAPYPTVRPWADWTILQYAVKGDPPIDRDSYRGSVDELRAAFGIGGLGGPVAPAPPLVLRLGDRGPCVVALQLQLDAHGLPLDPDGVFGPRTFAAVVQAQHELGHTEDGIADAALWTALRGG